MIYYTIIPGSGEFLYELYNYQTFNTKFKVQPYRL